MSDKQKWVSFLWDDQADRAAFIFNLWGEIFKALPKVLKIDEIGEIIPRYDANDIFVEEDPDGFLDHFGGKSKLMSPDNLSSSTLLFQPEFRLEYMKMRREEFERKQGYKPFPFLPRWLFLLFYASACLKPKKMGRDAIWKCLQLSHNSYYIFQDFWLFLVGWCSEGSNHQRTREANIKKKYQHYEVAKVVLDAFMAKSSAAPRFASKPVSQQADLLELSLRRKGVSVSNRTIRRILSKVKMERLSKISRGPGE